MLMIKMNYCHLPNSKQEYVQIIDLIENKMSAKDLDKKIQKLKGTKTVRHHYRTHLKNMGLIEENNGLVYLNNKVAEYKKGKMNIDELLKYLCLNNEDILNYIRIINSVITFNEERLTISIISKKINEIYKLNRNTDVIRRALSNLFKLGEIIGMIPEKDRYSYFLYSCEKIILHFVEYKESFPILKLKDLLYEEDINFMNKGLIYYLNKMQNDPMLRYRIAFINFPNWSTVFKGIKLDGEHYTHLKLYKPLIGKGGEEANE